MRWFRATVSVYETVRKQLDAAWGYPNATTLTDTAIPPAATLPTDSAGRVYLAIAGTYCDYILPSQMLPELLASGAVEEITEAEYLANTPQPVLPVE